MYSHADPPNKLSQLFGGTGLPFGPGVPPSLPPFLPSLHTYQSLFAFFRELSDSINHLCLSEVWFKTISRITRIFRLPASSTSRSKSFSVPYCGSTFS